MSRKRAVVSLGHDALGYTTGAQRDAVQVTARALADLVEEDYQLTITHSNGPQVSMIHKAMTELRRVYTDYTPAPMCVCSAMSQGYVGYDIQNALRSELLGRGISRPVSTILTQEAIRALAAADQVVIACGGGGIPVIEQQHILKGASAVIEKDAIAGKLAADLGCDELIIFTGVDCVYRDYGTIDQFPLPAITVAEAKKLIAQGQFEAGTMLPKIQAAVSYLEKVKDGRVLITSLSKALDAVRGKAGTLYRASKPRPHL